MKKMNLGLVAVLLVSLTLLAGCSIPEFPNVASAAQSATSNPMATPVVVQAPASAGAVAALEGALEQIYTQVNPSVVNIQVVQSASTASPAIPEIPGFPFGPGVPQAPQPQAALGSGFVWDKEGRIVTNNHVNVTVPLIVFVELLVSVRTGG